MIENSNDEQELINAMIDTMNSMGNSFKSTDSIECTREYLEIQPELERLIEEELKGMSRGLGFCHVYWATKKRILKEKYNIDWQSPAELMPFVNFD